MERKEVNGRREAVADIPASSGFALLMSMTSLNHVRPSVPLAVRLRIEGGLDEMTCATSTRRCSRPANARTYLGEGSMSHVGKVSFHVTHCAYLNSGGQPGGGGGVADLVVATPTGDEIHARCVGQQLEASKHLEVIRITGGTGVYVDATGSLLAIATVDPATLDVVVRGWGWMAL